MREVDIEWEWDGGATVVEALVLFVWLGQTSGLLNVGLDWREE